MKKKYLQLPIYIVIFTMLTAVALAIPSAPHRFYGNVIINGANAPDGIPIVAKIGGDDVAATTTTDSKYGYVPYTFYVQDPDGDRLGKTITFYVNDIEAATAIFNNGYGTRLDLSITQDTPPPAPSGGGGSSGGGGGSSATPSTTSQEDTNTTDTNETAEPELISACTPNWVCTDWLDCVNGVEKRVCTDTNLCETDDSKPEQSQECDVPENPFEEKQGLAAITAAVIGGGAASYVGIAFVLLVIVFALYLNFKKKK